MKIVRDKTGEYEDCLLSYVDFEDYGDEDPDVALFYGYAACRNDELLAAHGAKKKFYIDLHSPCGLFDSDAAAQLHLDIGKKFDKVFCACPYTVKWLNDLHGNDKYEYIIHPYNEKYTTDKEIKKEYDLIYWGGIYEDDHIAIANALDRSDSYQYFNLSTHPQILRESGEPMATGINAPRHQMWESLRKSKVMITSNQLYLSPHHIPAAKSVEHWEKNGAYSHIDTMRVPQIKTRPIEAAFNKTLMLIKRDPWNILEDWFEPDKEFIYYDSNEDLYDRIRDILDNWYLYQPVVDKAYDRAMEGYTSKKLIDIIKENC